MIPEPKTIMNTKHTPEWVKYVVNRVLMGDQVEGVNSIDVTPDNLVCYHRKITKEDMDMYPMLYNVDEVWVTQDIPGME